MGWNDEMAKKVLDIVTSHLMFTGSEPLLGPRPPGALEEKAFKLLAK